MFLESALAADARLKIVRTLFHEPLAQLDAAALSRETGRSVAGVHKALAELLPTRIVTPVRRGRTTYYSANGASPWFLDLLHLFRLERERSRAPHLFPTYWNHLEPIVGKLAAHPAVVAVILYGSLVRPPVFPSSDVDLLVVLRDKAERPAVDARLLGHAVSPLYLGRSAFERKAQGADAFMRGVLERHVVLHRHHAYDFPWERAAEPGPARRRGRVHG